MAKRNGNGGNGKNGNGKGRPELYHDRMPGIVLHLRRHGITTNKELASSLGIGISSFRKYMMIYPDFSTAVHINKHEINAEVEASLLKLCKGYDFEQVKVVGTIDKDGKMKKVKSVTKTIKHIRPETKAIELFLRNRMPDEWNKDQIKPEPEHEQINSFEEMIYHLAQTRGAKVGIIPGKIENR